MRLLSRTGGTLALAVGLLAGCGNDSNEPTPFDPAAMSADLQGGFDSYNAIWNSEVGESYDLAADALVDLSGGPGFDLLPNALRAAAGDRAQFHYTPLPHAAVILPDEVLGTTFVWDLAEQRYVASERDDAADDAVRFVIYDLAENELPADPLVEVGYIQVTDQSTASTDVARVVLVRNGTTLFDYRVTITGTLADGSARLVGYVSADDDRIEFDVAQEGAGGPTGTYTTDAEVEFVAVATTVAHRMEEVWTETSWSMDWTGSLRGPHGFLDMDGGAQEDDAGWTEEYVFEVNGEAFARYTCAEAEPCGFTDMEGGQLTDAEVEALEWFGEASEAGASLMFRLLYPVSGNVPL
jgi:hypothetical protein